MKKIFSIKALPFVCLLIIFLAIKFSVFGIRISDSNIYWYTGHELLQGKILYKDIFFTNFPLFAYFSAAYVFILKGNLSLFFLTPAIEAVIVACLIFYFVFHKTRRFLPATLSGALYLFSFIILATTDHQTGVFLASIFTLGSFIFLDRKKSFVSGIFAGSTILIKAYFLPIAAAFFLYLFLQRKYKRMLLFIIGICGAFFVVLLPSFILARQDFIKDVFLYSLTRGAGTSKLEIARFFITHDIVLFILLIVNLIFIKKHLLYGLISLCGVLFFFAYQDIYYLYLNFLIPFLALSFSIHYEKIEKKLAFQKMVFPTILLVFFLIQAGIYFQGFHKLQKIHNIQEMKNSILKENPQFLYGVNDITPALAYLTRIPLLNGVVDTNTNIFRKGYLNADTLTRNALQHKTIIVTHGAYYPQYGVEEFVVDEIVNRKELFKNCNMLKAFPVTSEGMINRINFFKCYDD